MTGSSDVKLLVNGKRLSGRSATDLRELRITAGVLKQANGSALVEWGKNKVIAGVYGPREVFPKHLSDPHKAIINCKYAMAPFCGMEEHSRSGPNRRSVEISKVVKHVFEGVVMTEKFPQTAIDITMEVLQSDGGTRISAVAAAAVALADAGIPMKDIVCGAAAGKIEDMIIIDLDKEEDNHGKSDMPVAVSLRTGEILLYQQDGLLTRDEFGESLDKVFIAAAQVRKKQAQAIEAKYASVEASGAQSSGMDGVK